MSHTSEPWKVSGTEHVVAAGQYVVALDCKPDDARRIVAAVNACAGIRTENLENNLPVKELATRYNAVIKQRDDLLAIVKRYRNEVPMGHQPHMITDVADTAIAAAEPKP